MSGELTHELAELSNAIEDPVAKLRYLRGAVAARREATLIERVPCAAIRQLLYRLQGLNALAEFAGEQPASISATAQRQLQSDRPWLRGVVALSVLALVLLVPGLVTALSMQRGTRDSASNEALTLAAPPQTESVAPESQTADTTSSPRPIDTAEPIAQESLGETPATIWLADRGEGWELYSHGLRIETKYAIAGEPRNYRVHDVQHGLKPEVFTRPVGILFHTSESDLWPLTADYGDELRRSSASLLRYVRNVRAYHFLIDRFGRVYRVVDEETRASHAGNGIWAHGDDVYLDLNGAFIGVSFESRWDGGRHLPINRAQLVAGRSLTHYLRQRFDIAPEMCVTHGLTSVNPRRYLIGYHRDWARGFPFEAFGLPDLYAKTLPSVALFGFSYDAEFLRAVGEPWRGLAAAETHLQDAARAQGASLAAFRSERRALYRQWADQVRDSRAPAVLSESRTTS